MKKLTIKEYKQISGFLLFLGAMLINFTFGWVVGRYGAKPCPPNPQEISYQITIDKTNYQMSIDYMKQCEGLRLTPYTLDGYSYIGYGHLITSKDPEWYKTEITESQADWIMRRDLLDRIEWCSKTFRVYGDKALALGMLFYNVSPNSIMKSDMYVQLLSEKPDNCIIEQSWLSLCRFQGKEHAGLKQRRQFEVDLFFGKE